MCARLNSNREIELSNVYFYINVNTFPIFLVHNVFEVTIYNIYL